MLEVVGSADIFTLDAGSRVAERYEIVRCLGAGRMGVVYLCRDLLLAGRELALKILNPPQGADDGRLRSVARFQNEIKATFSVLHENVVRTFDAIIEPELMAYTMEFVAGGDLLEAAGDGRLASLSRIVSVLKQTCAGMQAIHAAGIVHRDLKPANLLLTRDGRVKITDFGIARSSRGPRITATGDVVGTLQYTSPEYLEKGIVSVQGDVFALGTIAYQLITGRLPFEGDSIIDLIQSKISTVPAAAHWVNEQCPRALSEVVQRALDYDLAKRFQSASEMRAALDMIPRDLLHGRIRRESRSQPRTPGTRAKLVDSAAAGHAATDVVPLIQRELGVWPAPARLRNIREIRSRRTLRRAASIAACGSLVGIALAVVGYLPVSKETIAEITAPRPAEMNALCPDDSAGFVLAALAAPPPPVLVTDYPADGAPAAEVEPVSRIETAYAEAFIAADAKVPAPLPKAPKPFPPPSAARAHQSQDGATKAVALAPYSAGGRIASEPKPVVSPAVVAHRVMPAVSGQEPSMEFKVRATLLYRFTDYLTWPASSFSSNPDLTICVVGTNPFGRYLQQLLATARSKEPARRFALREFEASAAASDLANCRVLYLAEQNGGRVEEIEAALRGKPVLMVTENTGRGMIDFVIKDRKVKFALNLGRTEKAGIGVAEMLRDLAIRVTD